VFIPLPRIFLVAYWLVRFVYELIYLLLHRMRLPNEDKRLLEWRKRPNDSFRPRDHRVRYFAELSSAIKASGAVHLRYAKGKESTYRKVFPKRLFRRGEQLYLEAFCLRERGYRVFRLDRIKYLQLSHYKK